MLFPLIGCGHKHPNSHQDTMKCSTCPKDTDTGREREMISLPKLPASHKITSSGFGSRLWITSPLCKSAQASRHDPVIVTQNNRMPTSLDLLLHIDEETLVSLLCDRGNVVSLRQGVILLDCSWHFQNRLHERAKWEMAWLKSALRVRRR